MDGSHRRDHRGAKPRVRRDRATDLIWLLLLASIMTAGTLLIYESMLESIVDTEWDSRWQAVVAAITLFAPTSFFIGMTSPYLAKLNVGSLKETGRAIASLDMFNAIGGIVGTFVTGFILFGYIGAHQAIGLVALLLVAISWLIAPRIYIGKRLIISAILTLCALTPPAVVQGITKIETASAHYEVITGFWDDRVVTGLVTGPSGTQSAVYQQGSDDPVFWYVREATRLAIERQPSSVLVLGGGAFTIPQYLSDRLPGATVDVVEIDPALEDISRQYFRYQNPDNVNEIFSDARTYVNKTDKKYDVVIVDVYGDTSIPFTFTTKEYADALAGIVTPEGVVIANIIGGLKGECREALSAVDAAYRSQFPYVVYSNESGKPESRANHIMLYAREDIRMPGMKRLEDVRGTLYTDNFSPAERLYYECRSSDK